MKRRRRLKHNGNDKRPFEHIAHNDSHSKLRSFTISRHLPVPRRFKEAEYGGRHVTCRYLRYGSFDSGYIANNLEYLQTIVFILVIAALVQMVEIILKKYMPALYNALGIYLPLITTNCAVLGVVTLNVDNGYNFMQSLICAIGGGVGFMIAMIMFAGVRSRLESCDIPKFLKGLPITLVAASLVSLSFLGFAGVVDKIFA